MCKISAHYVKACMRKVQKMGGRTDGHHHTIIRPVWRRAYKNLQITSKLLTQGYRYYTLRKTFGKFFRSYSDMLSKFGKISFQEYVTEGISHPVFYGDLVYKLRRVRYDANFVSSGSKIHREDDRSCAWPFYSLVQIFPKALHSD